MRGQCRSMPSRGRFAAVAAAVVAPVAAVMVFAMALPGARASAAPAQDSTRQALKDRFEARFASLRQARQRGVVGETWQGYVALVETSSPADPALRRLVDAEIADRQALYALLAKDIAAGLEGPERDRMTPRVVAERNAWRNFERADETEPLRVADQTWVTKKERPWLLRLLELERLGRVGEASDGDVAPVDAAAVAERDVARVVELENKARQAFRVRVAQMEGAPVEQIARRQAKRHADAVHLGVLVQTAGGTWEPARPRPGD